MGRLLSTLSVGAPFPIAGRADPLSDKVEVPVRPYESPLRIPVSNVFKGQTAVASGVAVSGRLCSGVLQVGDRVRAVPGDEVANVRSESSSLTGLKDAG